MEWLNTESEIDGEILDMHRVFAEPVERHNAIISFCQETLENYRRAVLKDGFQKEGDEIEFFKIHKPYILGLLIQYRKQLSFILEYPELPAHHLERSVDKKIEKISSFLSLHRDFICYLKLGKTYMDELYFLRRNRKVQSCPIMDGFNFDPDFNTSHDFLLAAIKADTAFQQFLLHKLIPKSSKVMDFDGEPLLKWTGSKVALTELGFAIFHSGAVQNGNMPLKDLMSLLEKITGLDLGDYHHTSTRFRNRNNPTKFIDKMKNSMLSWMAAIDD